MKMEDFQKGKSGFTLIEIMIVIAIIGILSGVVLVNSKSAVDRANQASAMQTLSSVLPELVTCMEDGGDVSACTTDDTCSPGNVDAIKICSASGHSVKWPRAALNKVRWTLTAAAAAPVDEDYSYSATDGTTTISCRLSDNSCL